MQVLASVSAHRFAAGPTWADVMLLMPMETSYADVKNGMVAYKVGPPVISNAVNAAPFGANSGQFFDGGFLMINNLMLPDDAWTVEFWVNSTFDPNANPTVNRMVALIPRSSDAEPYYFSLTNGSVRLQYYDAPTDTWGAFETSSNLGDQITTGVPNHVAIVKKAAGNTIYSFDVFVNGKKASLVESPASSHAEIYPEGVIGGDPCTNNWLNGALKDFRITNGVWYTADFTRPTEPFPQG